MGEARRRIGRGNLSSLKNIEKNKKESSKRIFSWLPITEEQENLFIRFTIRGSWVGIACLVFLWIVVRFIGPAAGWWIPADL